MPQDIKVTNFAVNLLNIFEVIHVPNMQALSNQKLKKN